MEKRRTIVLIGFMGSGKSTIGKALSCALKMPFLDTDEVIEREAGTTISAIFEKEGEEAFRKRETELLKRLLSRRESWILSTGGGMPVRKENRALLSALGHVVYLKVSPETVVERLSGDTTRPLLSGENPEEKIRGLLSARESLYEEAAEVTIDTSQMSREEVLLAVREALGV